MNTILSNKTILILSYAFVYAMVVTLATFTVERRPVFLEMENSVYDNFQKHLTIDKITDDAYKKYEKDLTNLVLINLDSSYFDLETDRVRRDRLAFLLNTLSQESTFKGILLDFLFIELDNNKPNQLQKDSLLTQSLANLKSRLVLPYSVEFETIPVFGELSSNKITNRDSLLFKTDHTGYIAAMPSVGDESYRYVKIRMEEGSYESAVHALLKVLSNDNPDIYTKNMPLNFEVNYILRNQTKQAVPIIEASKITEWDQEQLQTRLNNKIIFIGLLDRFHTKYKLPIDKFETAVQKKMPGLYVLVNTYLNVVTKSYIRRASNKFVFIMNFLLALMGAIYFKPLKKIELKSLKRIAGEIVLSFLFFFFLLFFLFQSYYLKIPFVFTILFFVRNQSIYHQFHRKFLIQL